MLVLGGCRSGKSGFAEKWVAKRFTKKCFVATLEPLDDGEMRQRILLHRQSRGDGWLTVEEPVRIVEVMRQNQQDVDAVLVDCLTLWITNLLMRDMRDAEIEKQVMRLADAVHDLPVPVVLVANEVGLGLVPESALGRRFRDLAGWTNQQLAKACGEVVLMTAGLPMQLKGCQVQGVNT